MSSKSCFLVGLIIGGIIGFVLTLFWSHQKKRQASIGNVAEWTEHAKALELDVSIWKKLKKMVSENVLSSASLEKKIDILLDIRNFSQSVREQAAIVSKEAAKAIVAVLKSISPKDAENNTVLFSQAVVGAFGYVGDDEREVWKILHHGSFGIPESLRPVLLEARIHAGDKDALADLLENVVENPNYENYRLLAKQVLLYCVSPKLKAVAGIPDKINDMDEKTLLKIAEWLREHPVSPRLPDPEVRQYLFNWP